MSLPIAVCCMLVLLTAEGDAREDGVEEAVELRLVCIEDRRSEEKRECWLAGVGVGGWTMGVDGEPGAWWEANGVPMAAWDGGCGVT